jgi:hypothetical protein
MLSHVAFDGDFSIERCIDHLRDLPQKIYYGDRFRKWYGLFSRGASFALYQLILI